MRSGTDNLWLVRVGTLTHVALVVTTAVFLHACASRVTPRPRPRPQVGKTCAECHAPVVTLMHSGKAHVGPVEQTCGECHTPHGLVGVLKLKEDEPALCLRCHAKEFAGPTGTTAHPAVNGMACSSCHQPHGGTTQAFLREEGAALCLKCHAREKLAGPVAHGNTLDRCESCHKPHGSTEPHLLARAGATPATLEPESLRRAPPVPAEKPPPARETEDTAQDDLPQEKHPGDTKAQHDDYSRGLEEQGHVVP